MKSNKIIISGTICSDLEKYELKNGCEGISFDLLVEGKERHALVKILACEDVAEYITCNFKQGLSVVVSGYLKSNIGNKTTGATMYLMCEEIYDLNNG